MSLMPKTIAKTKGLRSSRIDNTQAVLMLLPMLAGFVLFSIYPMGWLIHWAWYSYDGVRTPVFAGVENFIRVFTRDPYYWRSLLNTFFIVGVKMAIEIPLAIFLAVSLNKATKVNAVYRTVFFMPSIISTAIIGLVFFLMFDPFQGVINQVLKGLGLIDKRINWFSDRWTANAVIISASIWKGFGVNMIFFLMGLQSIPSELYECANLDGASTWRTFRSITLPLLSPFLKTVIMLCLVNSMKMSDLVLTLTNGQPNGTTEVVMSYTFKYFFSYGVADAVSQYGYASALAVVTAMILGLITGTYFLATRKMGDVY